jgi:hypothetical protein
MRAKRAKAGSADPVPGTTTQTPAPIETRLLPLIDVALAQFAGRGLVPVSEVVDVLLDLRTEILLDSSLAELFDLSR